jgi:hypothetical protein
MNVCKKFEQECCVITADQAIYEIILVLQKKKPNKYRNIVLRLGGFHIATNFLGAIGHLMKESGIEDILSDAGVCKPGTANKIMAGKDYYLMVKAHSLIITAMFELQWDSFEQWVLNEPEQDLDSMALLSEWLNELSEAV